MKKIILFAMLLILSAPSFGQQTKPSPDLTKQDYLQKSKKQKKTAVIMLGGGAVLLLTSFIIPKGEQTGTTDVYGIFPVPEYKNDRLKAVLGLTGTASILGSIPFFIASGKNKRRAMKLSFKNETTLQIQKNSFVYSPVPSFTIKLSL
jgi:hypothetical protein